MIKLKQPNRTAMEVFNRTRAGIKGERRERISEYCCEVAVQSSSLAAWASGSSTTKPTVCKNSAVRADMEWLYEEKLKGNKRFLYDEIMGLTRVCPFCYKSEPDGLDHHLSKSEYPLLSVTPLNLVPACNKCNNNKFHRLKPHHKHEPIHPYFDDLDSQTWLTATAISAKPVQVKFSLDVSKLDGVLGERIEQQVEVLNLLERFEYKFTQDMLTLSAGHKRIFDKHGSDELKDQLTCLAEDNFEVYKNSDRGAGLLALSKSDWYCNGNSF